MAAVSAGGVTACQATATATIPHPAGTQTSAAASTTIRPQEIPVRYILVWFTSLPQTSSGSYQASLYNISFQGHP